MSRQDLALEQKVLRGLKLLKRPPRRILLALSGGADSMVMAEILYKWRRGLRLDLSVAHVHHGRAKSKVQRDYRVQAQKLVREWARERNLDFYSNSNRSSAVLSNEQEMRDFREKLLNEWCEKQRAEAVAFAHHRDDLLETRLIRMIRGSGPQGMRAMAVYSRAKLRPLLMLSSREIREYASLRQIGWLEDPSNEDSNILRNWLRHNWLPSLENQRPGAVMSLARSLETVSVPTKELDLAPYVGLRRALFVTGPTPVSRELLAQYLKALGLKGYSQTHVDEILKRLGSRRKNLAFKMLGLNFQVSAEFLWASRV